MSRRDPAVVSHSKHPYPIPGAEPAASELSSAESDPHPKDPSAVRVLSYNMHKAIGGRDRRYRLDRVIEVIERENPDIICLQEVDQNVRRSRFHDQPAMLADHFRAASWCFQRNVDIRGGGYGNLVLSRFEFAHQHHLCLRLRFKKARGAQVVRLATPHGELLLVNWHLGLADLERRWQVKKLLAHPNFEEHCDLPTLIIGDFNDWRNTLHRRVFSNHDFQQITSPGRQFRSFPAYMPLSNLDKAFYRGDLIVKSARVVSHSLAREASDHLPLVIDVHLRNGHME